DPNVQVRDSDLQDNTTPLVVTNIGWDSSYNSNGIWWGNLTGPAPGDLDGPNINVSDPRSSPNQCAVTTEDSDGDCLPDDFELIIGLSSTNPDSDADGLQDGAEVSLYGTHPLNPDTDGDGL